MFALSPHCGVVLMKARRAVGGLGMTGGFLMACVVIALCYVVTVVSAEEAVTSDCRPHEVSADADGALLTREENIARMDQALRDSLARFEQCRQGMSADGAGGAKRGVDGGSAGGSAAGGSADGGVHSADGGDQGADRAGRGAKGNVAGGAMESVAASDIQGTEVPVSDTSGTPSTDTMTSGTTMAGTKPLSGASPGAVPKDILARGRDGRLDPNNDSRLEAQIRLAAMTETDPEKQARLWNEYRRYKGLPLKPFIREQGGSDVQEESE